MPIGLSWMFNIRLPFNFDSPYRATSISEFWRRWHMSLSAFLRDYLYIALGGNRRGELRRYANLAVTMLLGGLWHGASWSFVLWGGLHGLYLVINHLFRSFCGERLMAKLHANRMFGTFSWALTMFAVVLAWIPFRAETLTGAAQVLGGMFGSASSGEVHPALWNEGLSLHVGFLWCAALGAITLLPRNTNHVGAAVLKWSASNARVRHVVLASSAVLASMLIALNTTRGAVSAFIYFNF